MRFKFLLLYIVSVFLLSSVTSIAQDSVYFYDFSGTKKTPIEQASIASIITQEDTGWLKLDYYTYSKKLKQIGRYKDREFKIENGAFKSFHANELIATSGYYKNGIRQGLFEAYYPNGMMEDSSYYINGIPVGNSISWYPDGTTQKLVQLDTLTNTTGIVVGYFPNGNVSYKGRLARGMRKIGIWNYYHENGNRASILKYPTLDESILNQAPSLKYDTLENMYYDSLVEYTSATCFDENGIEQKGCEIKNYTSQYKEGIHKWIRYLEDRMQGITNTIDGDQNTLIFICYFSTGTDGKINEVLLSNKVNKQLDNAVRNIFLKAKGWTSAMHNNRKIPFMHIQGMIFIPPEANKNLENVERKQIMYQTIEAKTSNGLPIGGVLKHDHE